MFSLIKTNNIGLIAMGNEVGRELSAEELRMRDIRAMDSEMKAKLEKKSIKYNLKVILKGDRNTGKTSLWRRLQGLPFVEAYQPTPEIQVCTINWDYKATNDVIKVEVWDVVDKARSKQKKDGLKLAADDDEDEEEEASITLPVPSASNATGSFTVHKLDAQTVDVYKGAHAVIFMIDPTKKWTYEYAQREIENVPQGMDVLLVSNYRDMGEYRTVKEKDLKDWVKYQPNKSLKSIEASMKNSFGLKGIVTFFNIPFLRLQREYIDQQLRQNQTELETVNEEFHMIAKEQNYDFHLRWLEQMKNSKKDGKSQLNLSGSNVPNRPSPPPAQPAPPAAIKQHSADNIRTAAADPARQPVNTGIRQSAPAAVQHQQAPQSTPVQQPPPANPPAQKKGFFSSMFSKSSNPEPAKKTGPSAPPVDPKKVVEDLKQIAAAKGKPTANIDDFAAGDLGEDFFGDEQPRTPQQPKAPQKQTSPQQKTPQKATFGDDSDEEAPNSLVARDEFADGDESSDEEPAPPPKITAPKATPPKNMKESTSPVITRAETTSPSISPQMSRSPQTRPSPVAEPQPSRQPAKTPQKFEDSDDEAPNSLVAVAEDSDSEDEPQPAKVVVAPKKVEPVKQQFQTKPPPAKVIVAPVEDDSDEEWNKQVQQKNTKYEENNSDDDIFGELSAKQEEDFGEVEDTTGIISPKKKLRASTSTSSGSGSLDGLKTSQTSDTAEGEKKERRSHRSRDRDRDSKDRDSNRDRDRDRDRERHRDREGRERDSKDRDRDSKDRDSNRDRDRDRDSRRSSSHRSSEGRDRDERRSSSHRKEKEKTTSPKGEYEGF
eukprot:TRINITY_DN2588_c0_g1_i3.p1 TRINITY_DN2588_c0_g1~~TRINITY_DN2588_c0_g1_i3.p1  ORF type:complete len:826 (-),score=292.03 TRINITY_DN2588_c0_g1_i3:742-3219(-)